MTQEEIITDLLKKVDNLQRTIDEQTKFIMRMVTYRDEREDADSKERMNRFLQIWNVLEQTDAVNKIADRLFSERPPNRESEQTH